MQEKEFISILEKIASGNATEEEIALYLKWYHAFPESEDLWAELQDEPEVFKNELLSKIRTQVFDDAQPVRRVRLWPKIAVAAAAVVAVVFGLWFFSSKDPVASIKDSTIAGVHDIAPGRNGATITLADGKVIALSDKKTGVVVKGGLVRYADGAAVGGPAGAALPSVDQLEAGKTQNLIASTAKGQTYTFTLPDGTKVWLNADSKISFPSQFNGKERKILLTGEGYFEVSKDKAHPFIVASRGQELEVLGTHFNVNAYTDEAEVKTTLLEGQVRVHSLALPPKDEAGPVPGKTLKPGQQAIFENNGFAVKNVDTEEAIAWKNGLFIFDDEPLQSVMKKVARWYDVEVVYADQVDKNQLYGGSVSRYDNISKLLEGLELTKGIHFKVEGRRITIMK